MWFSKMHITYTLINDNMISFHHTFLHTLLIKVGWSIVTGIYGYNIISAEDPLAFAGNTMFVDTRVHYNAKDALWLLPAESTL